MAAPPTVPKLDIPTRTDGQSGYPKPHVDEAMYAAMYKQSIENPIEFWDKYAKDLIHWHRPYTQVKQGGFDCGDMRWFQDGGLNASYNCADRWADKHPDKTAIIWEADEPSDSTTMTYRELLQEVCRLANVLMSMGVKKGDTVAIYLPMIPQAVVAFLACARIGAVHSVIFAGFSAESLRDRILDARSKVVITTDEGKRGGKNIATKSIVDMALSTITDPEVARKVIVYKRTGSNVNFVKGRDVWWHEACALAKPYCPVEIMDSEDPLFILYTSGSTGKPKGLVHTTGGYLLGAAMTVKYVFDVHEDDRFACMADVGWITGHTYIVYGPLMNGVTTTVFESTPLYPTPSRYWEIVSKHKLTQFYTAPTAIRLLRRLGDEHVRGHDLSSLRTIGSVGEPINSEAWSWYYEHVGQSKCAVVDTYWQTETGSIVITPLPGATQPKAGSATLPFFGIEPVLLEPTTGHVADDQSTSEETGMVEGVLTLKKPWPSMARTIYGDHSRFIDTYLKPYPGYYFTGDGAGRDADGYYWIRGRVDDVLNVSGHRLSTAEIESALILHPAVAETAVVGAPDETTGQTVFAFVTLKPAYGFDRSKENDLVRELTMQVRKVIGPFATPKRIAIVDDLPKTRSGKIMRRILRKVVAGESHQLGDLSTLSDPSVVETIIQVVDRKS